MSGSQMLEMLQEENKGKIVMCMLVISILQ